jgi:2-polyprenyl-3-methyl-5-hydroxy-6-metoxy-1,4-benzoquinol methylase
MPPFFTDKNQFILDFCRGKQVLNIGCVNHTLGATYLPDWQHAQLKTSARKLVGLDYEAAIVENLRERGWEIVAADAQDFDLRAQYPAGFEAVVASELIEHLKNPGGFLECSRRHLVPGGQLLITTPHAYGLFFFLQVLMFGEERFNDDHTLTFSRKNIIHLLDKCGFIVQEYHWLIRDTTQAHCGVVSKTAAKILFWLQCGAAWVRPGLSKELIVVAVPKAGPR